MSLGRELAVLSEATASEAKEKNMSPAAVCYNNMVDILRSHAQYTGERSVTLSDSYLEMFIRGHEKEVMERLDDEGVIVTQNLKDVTFEW